MRTFSFVEIKRRGTRGNADVTLKGDDFDLQGSVIRPLAEGEVLRV